MTQWGPPPPYGGQYPPQPPPPPGWQPGGYGYSGYGYPAYGYYGDGPPGRIRPTGTSILLFICTFGIYMFVYNYSVHDEMRRHSGRGIGGGIALLLSFVGYVAMPFVTPAEVGSLYLRKGQPAPVNGWTGLWAVVPAIGGYILQFFILFSSFATTSSSNDFAAIPAGFAFGFFIWMALTIGGGILWFTKTNDALNQYWYSVGVR